MILFKIAISITIQKNFKHFFGAPYSNVYFVKGERANYISYITVVYISVLVIKTVEISALIKIKDQKEYCNSRS